MKRLRSRDSYEEYLCAVEHSRRSIRRGNLREAKEWLAVAERCMRVLDYLRTMEVTSEKDDAWREENGYRLLELAKRAHSPG